MQHRPEEVARYTVERNGGEYTTDIADLLSLFGRKQLTDAARQEVRRALQQVQVGTDPDLLVAQRSDSVRLFLLEAERVRPARVAAASLSSPRRSGVGRLRPRTWKGWVGYGLAVLVIIVALTPDSEESTAPPSKAAAVEEGGAQAVSDAEAAVREERVALRRERERLRKQRAEVRRERARVRRERAQARRERARARRLAAARRERKRQEALAAQAAEPAANCHPSYDPCLDPNASDYDCSGGSGDGPEYTGLVTVKGPDDYDLDRDGDGTGCDS